LPIASNQTIVGNLPNASGVNSTAAGYNSVASGKGSLAAGYGNVASGTQSFAIGYGNLVKGNNSGSFGDPNVIAGNGSYAVGNNNTITANNAFVLGNNVTIPAGDDGAVVLGNNSASGGANTVSVGAPGAERRITNVAPGVNPTDAVNVSQLNNAVSNLTAMNYDLRRRTGFGIAGATALAMIPPSSSGKKVTVGMGYGTYDGYSAGAVSITATVSDNVQARAGVSFSGSQSTAGAGLSFGF
jgi:trimeric autotransporter adhesin